ncbi:MAG: hypothetical protein JRC92_12335 [Deltaproteobacteria bacterium]|nr:hypothetical protein [Deltaproteobacteria bacterium]
MKQEDLDKWAKRDPIDLCQKKLLSRKQITKKQDTKLRSEVRAEVEEAVEYAMSSPDPTIDDLFEDIVAARGVL